MLTCVRRKAGGSSVRNTKSKYQPDGTFIDGRATRNMDRFAVRRDNASLVVNMSHWFESDKDSAGWASAFAQL